MSTASLHHRRYRASDPRRKAIGWSLVIGVHALIGWALVTGTARKGLEILKKPMEAAVIQEVIIPPPPPPPPPKKIEPPKQITPKVVAPPPPFVPPPEVSPPPSTSAVAVPSVPTPPVTAPVIAPPAPPAPPAPSGPQRQAMGVVCPTQVKPEMPAKAVREGVEGVVKAQILVHDGVVKQVTILSGPRALHETVRDAMMQYKCVSGAGDVIATQEFVFKIE